MDKWKIVVIVVLLGALGGYSWMQQNAGQTNSAPADGTPPTTNQTPNTQTTATVPPQKAGNQQLLKLRGKVPPAWNIEKKFWVNTAAPISLESLKGSVAIVEFWRIGCSHCQQAAPFLNALYQKHKARGLKMVAIQSPGLADSPLNPPNPENNWGIVQQVVKQLGITYPVAFDEGGKLFKATYSGDTYPATIILDRQGKVQSVFSGHTPLIEVQFAAALEAALDKK